MSATKADDQLEIRVSFRADGVIQVEAPRRPAPWQLMELERIAHMLWCEECKAEGQVFAQ